MKFFEEQGVIQFFQKQCKTAVQWVELQENQKGPKGKEAVLEFQTLTGAEKAHREIHGRDDLMEKYNHKIPLKIYEEPESDGESPESKSDDYESPARGIVRLF